MTQALLTTPQVAELLAVSDDTVQRLVKRGKLNAIRLGRSVRFDVRDVAALIGRDSLADRPPRTAEPETTEPLTDGQRRALHARCNALDRRDGDQPQGTWKKLMLKRASERYGRPITSANDLSTVETGWILDRLEEAIG